MGADEFTARDTWRQMMRSCMRATRILRSQLVLQVVGRTEIDCIFRCIGSYGKARFAAVARGMQKVRCAKSSCGTAWRQSAVSQRLQAARDGADYRTSPGAGSGAPSQHFRVRRSRRLNGAQSVGRHSLTTRNLLRGNCCAFLRSGCIVSPP